MNPQALLVVGEKSGFRPESCVWFSGLSIGSDMAFPGRALGGSCSPRTRRGAQTVHRGLWGAVSPSHRLRPPGQPDSCVCVCILSLGPLVESCWWGALPQALLRETSLLRGLAETLSAHGLGTSPLLSLPSSLSSARGSSARQTPLVRASSQVRCISQC